jgi:hypothetical protein
MPSFARRHLCEGEVTYALAESSMTTRTSMRHVTLDSILIDDVIFGDKDIYVSGDAREHPGHPASQSNAMPR